MTKKPASGKKTGSTKPGEDKKPDSSSERAAKRQARREGSGSVEGPYKMRSAASRRAEARARAAYRGVTPGMEGPEAHPEARLPVRDVGIRINPEGDGRAKQRAAELEHAMIVQLLHNPTKQVAPEALRAQYSYVIADIRSMALLAAGLFALLIVLALVLPTGS